MREMIKSMTGYGRAESLQQGKKWVVEVKSLNHRYQEIFVRLPASLLALEGDIKRKVGERLSRGRVEVGIRMDSESPEGEARFDLNLPLIQHYHALLARLKETMKLKDEISLQLLTGFKDAFVYKEAEVDPEETWKDLVPVLEEALVALAEMRRKEGEIIYRDILQRIDLIKERLAVIDSRAPEVVREYQKRLSERIKDLTGGMALDESRLTQEVAIMAERMDITEEIVRFRSHVSQLEEMLSGDEAAGRKIDFLLQEMNREVNTMGSKSSDTETSRQVVDIKSELAKLREQVQNIE